MSGEESWRTRLNLMGKDNLNELDRWRADNAKCEDDRQRRVGRTEELAMIDQIRVEMQREIANLRAELHRGIAAQRQQEREFMLEVTGTAIGEFSNKEMDLVEKAIKEIREMLSLAIERRFGEVMGRIDAIAPDARSRARPTKDFRFANEDNGPVDLPNPLVRKVTMN